MAAVYNHWTEQLVSVRHSKFGGSTKMRNEKRRNRKYETEKYGNNRITLSGQL